MTHARCHCAGGRRESDGRTAQARGRVVYPERQVRSSERGGRVILQGYPVMPYATISHPVSRATRTRRHRARRSGAWRLAGRALVALCRAPLAVRIIVATVLLVAV